MDLIAERGFPGASLRELARRVKISQPSLYHYFVSKDQLIEQIVDAFADKVISLVGTPAPEDVPDVRSFLQLVLGRMDKVFGTEGHGRFVGFAYRIALERKEFGRVRERFLARVLEVGRSLFAHYEERGQLRPGEGELMLRLATNAMVLHLLQTRVFGSGELPGLSTTEFADFIVDVVSRGVQDRAVHAALAEEQEA